MTQDDVKAFATRDWTAVSDADALHWAAEFRERGSVATVEASRALWEHVRRIGPEWPTADDSARDFAEHLRLKRLFDRAAHIIVHR